MLREVERGATLVVTRHNKPIATLKAFEKTDLERKNTAYPTTVWDNWIKEIEEHHPELKNRSEEKARRDFERISKKM